MPPLRVRCRGLGQGYLASDVTPHCNTARREGASYAINENAGCRDRSRSIGAAALQFYGGGSIVAASADHIKALVKSHGSGDDDAFYAIALQVAAKAARQGVPQHLTQRT